MDYLWNADHLSRSKFSFEHLAYCSPTFDWLLRYLMVHSIFVIKLREGRSIILVEPLNKIFYHLTRAHEPLLSIATRFETLSGTIRLNCTTLMSAFPSSRRVNLWLPWKRLVQALPGKAGGTAVMTTVDHTLMRGSKPHDR